MRLLAVLVIGILVNGAALWVATLYVPGFHVAADPTQLAIAALILTLLNAVLKPLLKLVLGPVIILTLGLGLLIVNGIILYILDLLSANVRIETLWALFLGTLILAVANIILHAATKHS